eukprot:191700-Pleurochrysis_carterae.AAC.1
MESPRVVGAARAPAPEHDAARPRHHPPKKPRDLFGGAVACRSDRGYSIFAAADGKFPTSDCVDTVLSSHPLGSADERSSSPANDAYAGKHSSSGPPHVAHGENCCMQGSSNTVGSNSNTQSTASADTCSARAMDVERTPEASTMAPGHCHEQCQHKSGALSQNQQGTPEGSSSATGDSCFDRTSTSY